MMSIEEVANALNITKQRAIQIERVALRKVKSKLLELDCQENWVCILLDTKEKDPYCTIYTNNLEM